MTEIFDLADRIVEGSADADPIMATYVGVPGRDHLLTDYSVPASDARAEQARGWLAELDGLTVTGEPDRVAAAVIRERLGSRLAMHDVGEHLRDINVLGGPVQSLRDILTLMPTGTDEEWGAIASRLEAIPAALDQVRSSFEQGMARGVLPARRQVLGTARTAAVCAGLEPEAEGEQPAAPWFEEFASGYAGADTALAARLAAGASGATSAYAECAAWLRDVYAPAALEEDAVGRDRYVTLARVYCGADIDPEETYAWGWDDLARITRRMNDCASRLYGGVTPVEAQARLDVDPEHDHRGRRGGTRVAAADDRRDHGVLDGTHFDIPEPRCAAARR